MAVFQQQSSLDLLEAEWDALQQGTSSVTAYYVKFIELCSAVQADIASAFVVRKFLPYKRAFFAVVLFFQLSFYKLFYAVQVLYYIYLLFAFVIVFVSSSSF